MQPLHTLGLHELLDTAPNLFASYIWEDVLNSLGFSKEDYQQNFQVSDLSCSLDFKHLFMIILRYQSWSMP